MSSFTVLCSRNGMMIEHQCDTVQDLFDHMCWVGAEQINLVVIWASQANKGQLMRTGEYAIVCTSGKRAINPNVIQVLMQKLKN